MDEIWKAIVGYEGLYEVSNLGRVRSLDRLSSHIFGSQRLKGKIKSQYKSKRGYPGVSVSKDGKCIFLPVHRLATEAFFGPRGKLIVNHMDGDKTNNRLDNLEYCTPSENIRHAFANGLNKRGEACSWARLTERDVRMIREYRDIGIGVTKISRMLGLPYGATESVARGATWGWLAHG